MELINFGLLAKEDPQLGDILLEGLSVNGYLVQDNGEQLTYNLSITGKVDLDGVPTDLKMIGNIGESDKFSSTGTLILTYNPDVEGTLDFIGSLKFPTFSISDTQLRVGILDFDTFEPYDAELHSGNYKDATCSGSVDVEYWQDLMYIDFLGQITPPGEAELANAKVAIELTEDEFGEEKIITYFNCTIGSNRLQGFIDMTGEDGLMKISCNDEFELYYFAKVESGFLKHSGETGEIIANIKENDNGILTLYYTDGTFETIW